MYELKGASLLEAVAASSIFMIVFALSLELLPKLTPSGSDGLAAAEMRYIARRKYADGLWPAGEYVERYDCGRAKITIEPYRDFEDVAMMTVTVECGTETAVHKELVRCE